MLIIEIAGEGASRQPTPGFPDGGGNEDEEDRGGRRGSQLPQGGAVALIEANNKQ